VNDGTFAWTVPTLNTTLARVRVAATDGQATTTDESDANFTMIYSPPPPPERSTVSVGDGEGAPLSNVTVPLILDNRTVAIDLETTLSFDESGLEFVQGVAVGRGLAFPFTAAVAAPGQVLVRFQQQGQAEFAVGDSPVAELTFHLLGPGGTEQTVTPGSTQLLDTDGDPLNVQNSAGTIAILNVDTPASLTRDGWVLFEAGDFVGAKGKFDDAILLDADYGPAYTGRGWSQLQLARIATEFQAALAALDAAIARQQTLGDARGGRAATLLALGGSLLPEAVAEAGRAAAPDPLFVFAHRTSFDLRDLYLIEAFAQAGRGRFTEARDAADRIAASNIRSGDPGTWQVDGVTYATFEGAVLAFLQKMSNLYAG
jgi:tetratricopeptide (TPR) repeat protein